MSQLVNLVGSRFGRLVVQQRDGSRWGQAVWRCQCDCGSTKSIPSGMLKQGLAKSCGCWRKERPVVAPTIKHGHACDSRGKSGRRRTGTYVSWSAMKARCDNPHTDGFEHYGGRGITYAAEWVNFDAFLRDMGERPRNATLDRIDPDGDYTPSNTRWATCSQQNANKRPAVRGIKLTRDQANEIRRLKGQKRRKAVAAEFCVSESMVKHIWAGTAWAR